MPLYEFACDDCKKRFEVLFRSMTERRPPQCSRCRSRRVRKLFSTFATTGGNPGKGRGENRGCATCRAGSCATCGP
ncbi:MAG TPA: FmdB family zinc ribbon protein [Phycisphaerae bacterium]|nr:FmdB family zinc ribbon protein [Phycisphaerae bacterium]